MFRSGFHVANESFKQNERRNESIKHKEIKNKESSQFIQKSKISGTYRPTFRHIEGLCAPNDEDDRRWKPHKHTRALKTGNRFQQILNTNRVFHTYDGEDECVGEVSVERELHHVPPQPQQLHRLSQTHKDVTKQSRNITGK